jgi:hypothetical protein
MPQKQLTAGESARRIPLANADEKVSDAAPNASGLRAADARAGRPSLQPHRGRRSSPPAAATPPAASTPEPPSTSKGRRPPATVAWVHQPGRRYLPATTPHNPRTTAAGTILIAPPPVWTGRPWWRVHTARGSDTHMQHAGVPGSAPRRALAQRPAQAAQATTEKTPPSPMGPLGLPALAPRRCWDGPGRLAAVKGAGRLLLDPPPPPRPTLCGGGGGSGGDRRAITLATAGAAERGGARPSASGAALTAPDEKGGDGEPPTPAANRQAADEWLPPPAFLPPAFLPPERPAPAGWMPQGSCLGAVSHWQGASRQPGPYCTTVTNPAWPSAGLAGAPGHPGRGAL